MEEQTIKLLNKIYGLASILTIGILVFFVSQIMLQSRAIDVQDQNQITVSGEGKVYVKPDVALINLGVLTQAETVADATEAGVEKMNDVIEAVKAMGVETKDIQTTNYNLTPNYESAPVIYSVPYRGTSSVIIGYTLSQTAEIKIRDFTKIGYVLSDATEAGANVVGNLQFTIDNPEQFKQEARAKAIVQAKANAENLERESGIKMGKLINVYENYYPYSTYNKSVGLGGATIEAVPASVIEPGQQEINVTVNLTYRVK